MLRQDIFSRDNTQWAQGLSILGIMVMHYVMRLDSYPRVLNIIGSIGVAVFLFASGFGINESYRHNGLAGYWRKRIVRVVIPCWIVFLFRLPFADGFDPETQLLNFFFIDSDLWYIDFIVRWYIVYWVARRFAPRFTVWILAAFGIVCIFMEQLMAEQAFSFFAGYLASEHYDRIKTWNRRRVARIMLCIVIYGALFTVVKQLPPVRQYIGTLPFNIILLNIKLPLAAPILAAPFLLPWLKRIQPINWLGKVSYEVYIVHFNFMNCITGVSSIFGFMAGSLAISAVFNKINVKLKDKRYQNAALSAVFYIAICYLLACKYTMRATDSFGYVCLTYITLLGGVILLLTGNSAQRLMRWPKATFWTLCAVLTVAMLAVQYHFDPMQNNVDRWSAIANPLTALFNGDFPYLAKTHLGGNSSPFPVWLVLHIPFWALGNVGLSEIVASLLFIYSVKMRGGYTAGIKAALLLALSVNIWYETAVRSDLISNFLLLAAFINLLIHRQITFSARPYLLSVCAALWLSTRLSTAFPLFLMFFPYWLKLDYKRKTMTLLVVIAVFCLTFLPLAVWDWQSLFFAENNPFSLQSRQGRPADTVILIAAAVLMALRWRGDSQRLMLYSAVMLVLTTAVAYIHNMWIYSNWTDFFSSAYDITYFNASLPFCITLLATAQTAAMKKSLQQ